MYSGEEVIEVFEKLQIIEVLENPIIDSIMSNLQNGRYVRESLITYSTAYKALNEGINNVPGYEYKYIHSLAVIRYKHDNTNKKFKHSRSESSNIKIKDSSSNNMDTEKADRNKNNKIKGNAFQFYVWKESFDVQLYFNLISTIILSIAMLIFANRVIDQQTKVENTRSSIDIYEAIASPTASDLSTIETLYSQLNSQSNIYKSYIYTFMGLSVCTFSYLIRNLEIAVYTQLKFIGIPFRTETIMNFASF